MTQHDAEKLPPFFLRLRAGGKVVKASMVDLNGADQGPLSEYVELTRAPKQYYWEIGAPNGAKAQDWIAAGSDYHQFRKTLLSTLKESCPLGELWIDPGEAGEVPQDVTKATIGLLAWADSGSLLDDPGSKVGLARRSGKVEEYRIQGPRPPRFLQFWSEPGPSIIASLPPGTTFSTALAGDPVRQPFRLMNMPRRDGAAAYWGFFRHGASEASGMIGAATLDEVAVRTSRSPNIALEQLLVAAHFAIRSVADPKRRAIVREALGACSATDARIARWVIGFDDETMPIADLEADFWTILRAFPSDPPTSTEIFRLFYERYDSALGLLRDGADYDRSALEAVRMPQLAAATYWNAQYLTYRGLMPGHPDASARGADVESGLKKKASFPLSPRAH